jgi:hypothetical protein
MPQPQTLNQSLEVNGSFDVAASQFNHCSSVCPFNDGVLITWYSGFGECLNDQSVHCIFIDKYGMSGILRLGDKTGNPIAWEYDGKLFILWSRFEDTGDISNPVNRWKYCSLWIQECYIGLSNGNNRYDIKLLDKPQMLSGPEDGLLARCNPIAIDGEILLPLYHESQRHGVIMKGKNKSFRTIGNIDGADIIQPTLWESGGIIHSLSRDFSSHSALNKARYSLSEDRGMTWSDPVPTNIHNRNNSIHVINYGDDDFVLWNNSSHGRDNLTLGILHYESLSLEGPKIGIEPIMVVNKVYGSYPSIATHNSDLYFSYTTDRRTISYNLWSKEYVERQKQKESTIRRGNSFRRPVGRRFAKGT